MRSTVGGWPLQKTKPFTSAVFGAPSSNRSKERSDTAGRVGVLAAGFQIFLPGIAGSPHAVVMPLGFHLVITSLLGSVSPPSYFLIHPLVRAVEPSVTTFAGQALNKC
ncbi:hypothetical protein J1614_008043 [Plenodomus biglobosus]|nr:hypothetical protein J1614_008043 [Plenodomus biglobosus]